LQTVAAFSHELFVREPYRKHRHKDDEREVTINHYPAAAPGFAVSLRE
jgi:hypothetical protein